MISIAVFSDIHANLPALEAVLADMDRLRPDVVLCLGDLVGYNMWPNEVAQAIRARGIPTIAGNYDEGIGLASDDCGCAYRTAEEKANGAVSIAVTNELVTDDVRRYLRLLPRQMSLRFHNDGQNIHALMVHGSPRKINEYLFEDRPEKSLLRIMEDAQADLMLVGHTHKPYHRVLTYQREDRTAYRHAVNIGSVGKPKDGDPRACYVIIRLVETLSLYAADAVRVEFRRVPYDVEQAVAAITHSALPNAYAEALRLAQ